MLKLKKSGPVTIPEKGGYLRKSPSPTGSKSPPGAGNVLYSTVLYSTVLYSTVLYSTVSVTDKHRDGHMTFLCLTDPV